MAVGSVPAESVQQPGRETGLAGEGGRVGEPFLLGAGLGGEEPEDVGAYGRGVVEQGREAAARDGPYGAWGERGEGGRVAGPVEQRDLVEGAGAGPRPEPYDASGGGRGGRGRGAVEQDEQMVGGGALAAQGLAGGVVAGDRGLPQAAQVGFGECGEQRDALQAPPVGCGHDGSSPRCIG